MPSLSVQSLLASLAHIVARHAGYRPLEVNASDERSANVLTERVYRAMESTTLNIGAVSKDVKSKRGSPNCTVSDFGKPNCLILDEVDGADAKGAVAALVELIRAEVPPRGGKNGDTSSSCGGGAACKAISVSVQIFCKRVLGPCNDRVDPFRTFERPRHANGNRHRGQPGRPT